MSAAAYLTILAMIANLAVFLYLMFAWAEGIDVLLLAMGYSGILFGIFVAGRLAENRQAERRAHEKLVQAWKSETATFLHGRQEN